MAKTKAKPKTTQSVVDDLTTSEAPEAVVPPLFYGFEETPEPEGMQTVTLTGGGPLDGAYRLPIAIPQSLSHATAKYDLSDRAAGVYVWKYR